MEGGTHADPYTRAWQPQGSWPGWPVHPSQLTTRSASAQYPLQETRHCLCNRDHPKRLLHSAGASRDFALSLHPIDCLFVFLFEQKMGIIFFPFLYNHKPAGDANRQLNVHGACLPGTSGFLYCKKRTFSAGRDSPTSLSKGSWWPGRRRPAGQRGRGSADAAPCL